MRMKKFISFVVICFMLIGTTAFAIEQPLNQAGDLLETDIKAYINGCRINSYNVNGYTALIAEDLAKYGFSVIWNNDARTVTIIKSDNTEFSGEILSNNAPVSVGKKIGTAYYTDIRTTVNGITVLSYNIGGKTAIFTDALKLYGTVKFDNTSRSVQCTIEGLTYKKPLVTITDPENSDEIDVEIPVIVPVPENPALQTGEFYSNEIVPNYGYLTNIPLLKSEEIGNDYISYTYDNYDEFAAEKYISYIVDKENFNFNKTTQKDNSITYYYVKDGIALAIEIDNAENTITLTCKK